MGMSQHSLAWSTIGFPAVLDAIDHYFLVRIINLVQNTIIANSETIAFATGQFD